MSRKSQARRVSILKPPRVETNDDEDEAKVRRKVRFSSNFVKEFVSVKDENYMGHTIWANDTYEEAIERSSASNASSQLHDKENVLPHKGPMNTAPEKAKNDFFPDFTKASESTNPTGDAPKNSGKFALPNFVKKAKERSSKNNNGNISHTQPQNESLFPQRAELDIRKSVLFAGKPDGAKRKSYFNSTAMGNDSCLFEMTQEIISPLFPPDRIDADTEETPGGGRKTIFFHGTMEETKVVDVKIRDNLLNKHKVENAELKLRPTIHFCQGDDAGMEITQTGAGLLYQGQENVSEKSKSRQTIHSVDGCGGGEMDITQSESVALLHQNRHPPWEETKKEYFNKSVCDAGVKEGLPAAVIEEDSGVKHGITENVGIRQNGSEKSGVNLRPAIHCNVHSDDADMNIRKAVEKSRIFDVQNDKTNKSVIKLRQTIFFNVNSEDGDMDMTQGAGNFCHGTEDVSKGEVELKAEGKTMKTISAHSADAGMDMTRAVERNSKHVEDDKTNKSIAKPRQTILFNVYSEDGDMNMTQGAGHFFQDKADVSKGAVEFQTEGKSRKTIHFHAYSDDADMDMTIAAERTNIFDIHDNETNKCIAKPRQTILYNVNSEDGDMNMTQAAGNFFQGNANLSNGAVEFQTDGKSKNTIHFHVHSDDADMDMTREVERTNIIDVHDHRTNKSTVTSRQMIVVNVHSEDGAIDMTQGTGNLFQGKQDVSSVEMELEAEGKSRKTILFNAHSDDADMDMTRVAERTNITDVQEDKTNKSIAKPRPTIIFNHNSVDGDMNITQGAVELRTEGKSRKTILFKAHSDDADMDITSALERTSIIDVQNDKTNKSSAKPHQTIPFNVNSEDGDMNMTQGAGNIFHGKADVSKGVVELKTEEKSRKTTLLNAHSDDADMNITKAVERRNIFHVQDDRSNKSIAKTKPTKIFNVNSGDMAQGAENLIHDKENIAKGASNIAGKSRKTTHFNVLSDDADMDITQGTGNFIQDGENIHTKPADDKYNAKTRQTILFNVHSDDADMDMSKSEDNSIIEPAMTTKNTNYNRGLSENSGGTQIFDIPMEETALINLSDLKCNATAETITKSRKTIHFNVLSGGGDMDMTQGGGNFIQNNPEKLTKDKSNARMEQTILFNINSDDADMDMTKTAGNLTKKAEITTKNTKSNRSIYENNDGTKLLEIPMEDSALIDPCSLKCQDTKIENLETVTKSRKTIHFNVISNDADMDITQGAGNFIQHKDSIPGKPANDKSNAKTRKTILFNVQSDDANMDMTRTVGNVVKEAEITTENTHYNRDVLENKDESQMLDIPKSNVTVETIAKSRQTIHFNVLSDDGDMDMTPGAGNFMQEKDNNREKPAKYKCDAKSRQTILFNVHSDDADMDMTKPAGDLIKEAEITIKNTNSNRSIYEKHDGTKVDTPMEETALIDPCSLKSHITGVENHETTTKSRKTIHFDDVISNNADMDMTHGVGNFIQDKENIPGKPANDKSNTKKRKTILFNVQSDDADMIMTRTPGNVINEAEITTENTHYNRDVFENKDGSQMIDIPKSNVTVETIVKSRKTIHFNVLSDDGDMDMTPGAGHFMQEKDHNREKPAKYKCDAKSRQTILFNVHSDDADMDMTKPADDLIKDAKITTKNTNSNRSIYEKHDGTKVDVPMEETALIDPCSLKSHITGVENYETVAKSRKTIHFNVISNNADMDMTQGVGNLIQDKENIPGKPAADKDEAIMIQTIFCNAHSVNMAKTEAKNLIRNVKTEIEHQEDLTNAKLNTTIPINVSSDTADVNQVCADVDFSHAYLFGQIDPIWDDVENEAGASQAETITRPKSRKSRTTIHFNLPQEGKPKEENVAEKETVSIDVTADKKLKNVTFNVAGVLKTNTFAPHEDSEVNVTKVIATDTQSNLEEIPSGYKELDTSSHDDRADIHMQLTRTIDETISMTPTVPPQILVQDFDQEENVVEEDSDDCVLLDDVPVEFYSPAKSPDLEDLQYQEALIFNRKRFFEDSPACVQQPSKRIDGKATPQPLSKLLLKNKASAKRSILSSPQVAARGPAKKLDLKETPVKYTQMQQPTSHFEAFHRDPIESVLSLNATLNEPITKTPENSSSTEVLRIKYLKPIMKEIHLSEIDSSKFTRKPIKLSLGIEALKDLDEEWREEEAYQKEAQILQLLDTTCHKRREQINEQIKKLRLEIEELDEPIDIQKILAASMTLTDKIRQKARIHDQYKIRDVNEECLRVFVPVGEFELSVMMKKDCGTVVSLDVDEPIPDEKTNDIVRWVRKFFHHLMNPQRIKSYIGPEFSVLSLLDYLEYEMEKFGETLIAVYHSKIMFMTEFKDDLLIYRHFKLWLDVEVIVNLSDFNMEKVTVGTIIHDGRACLRIIEDIIAEQPRDTKFPLNVLTALDKYFKSISQRKTSRQ